MTTIKEEFNTKLKQNFFYNFKEYYPEEFSKYLLKFILSTNDNRFIFDLNKFYIAKDFDNDIKLYYSNDISEYVPFLIISNIENVKKIVVNLELIKLQFLHVPIVAVYGDGLSL